jgi:phosphate uptake regulator
MKIKLLVMVFVVAICFITFQDLVAAEDKIELRQSAGIKEVLAEFTGKRVSVTLDSGVELGGIITRVGDHLVHISRLTGRDYFDALIRIDRISSVIVRAKSDR